MRLYADLPDAWTAPLPSVQRVRRGAHPKEPGIALLPLDEPDIEGFIARCAVVGAEAWVACGSVPEVRRAAGAGAHLWLSGLETGGRCGEVGALVLIREAHRSGAPWVAQGLGIRAMAASLAVGAHGVVLDALLWATDESPLHPTHKERMSGRSGRDTQVTEGSRTTPGTLEIDWITNPQSAIPAPACFGQARAGSVAAVLAHIRAELLSRSHNPEAHPLHSDPFGTGRPLVQGPMANVTEKPDLAGSVLASGGLPFCALGALGRGPAATVLAGMGALEGPWGAGVIGFDVMPHRDAHLAAIDASGSRPVILAGGSPALAQKLLEAGHEPWLHTPSARLAQLALRRGVGAVVFEGREAGGHVGAMCSSTLWEEGLAVAETTETSALFVLAGGIGDAVSAAFAGSMSARAHQRGHRIALQVGTALFFTHEIVEAGQITGTYQQAALSCERTVTVGQTVNLPLQCSPNTFTHAAQAQETTWAAEGLSLDERRSRVEHHNLGRTRIAAKGIERDGQGGHQRVPVKRQLTEGAFTMGQGAATEHRLFTVEALFKELTEGAMALLDAVDADSDLHVGTGLGSTFGPVRTVDSTPTIQHRPLPTAQVEPGVPLAIVGIGCVLPGAPDPQSYWRLLVQGGMAIRPVPDRRWRASRYFDPNESVSKSYTRMAGIIEDFVFDPIAFGIPPRVVPSMDRAQQLALVAAAQAIEGVKIRDRRRAAVILGNSMGGEHAKSLAVRIRFREVLAALEAEGALSSLSDAELAILAGRVEARLAAELPPVDVESMSGLLSNVIAGRVASWLDLMGGNATMDAACAASLAAISTAADWLRTGRVDVVLTGGVDADLSPETFVGFCRTYALSRVGALPFSAAADGFVMGEGAAVFAVKRLPDAIADEDTVWAVLRGIGQSSDGRSSGITAPRSEGQRLAIQRAFTDCDLVPADIGMVEAHGTGTSLGDRTELSALSGVYAGNRVALGSVKAQIGHLKGGAGAAGVLKAVLAVAHGIVPPTLTTPPLAPSLQGSPFELVRAPSPFRAAPPRAAVSAFGFGGTNYHLLLEAPATAPPRWPTPPLPPAVWSQAPLPAIQCFGADDRATLSRRIRAGHTLSPEEAASAPVRACLLDADPGAVAKWVQSGAIGAFARSAWCGEGAGSPPVWLFPGQGSPRRGAIELLHRLPGASKALQAVGVLEPSESADPAAQHHLLVACAIGWTAALAGVPCAGVIGHSVGELGAMVAAGRLEPAEALALAEARGAALQRCPRGAMLAVAAAAEELTDLIASHGLHLAARNSPMSTVLAGSPSAVDAALEQARSAGLRATRLDVERAFHTPAVEPAAAAVGAAIRSMRLRDGKTWWSNVGEDDGGPDALVRAIATPVDFLACVERAAAAGHRLFVHIGPGGALSRHVEQIVPNARVIAIQADPNAHRSSGLDLVRAAAELTAEGHPALLRSLPGTLVHLPFPLAPPNPEARSEGGLVLDAVAPEPLAEEAPAESVASPELEGTRAVVIAAIGEITGYPPEALTAGARLDTDLGVDSIRKMEIVGLLQEQLNLEINDTALTELGSLDLDGLVRWIEDQVDDATHETADAAPSPPHAGSLQPWTRMLVPIHEVSSLEVPPDLPLVDLLRPWLGKTPDEPIELALDPQIPSHHGLAAFLRVLGLETGTPCHLQFVSEGRVWKHVWARALDIAELPEEPVVFATGGTSGIVEACVKAIPGARGMFVGRREHADVPEGFCYRSCDVTEAESVAMSAADCRNIYGRIDIVVHGAGVLRDGPATARTLDDLDAVCGPKLDGAAALFAATLDDAPLYVPFSSVSATLVNPNQSIYAAANATLEQLRHPTGRTLPLAWTAWSERGMAKDPSLLRLLRARGIRSLTPAAGSAAFVQALKRAGTQWLAHEEPPGGRLPWPLTHTGSDRFAVALDPADPVLHDHSVGGIPLVPAALWLAALTQAATLLLGSTAVRIADLAILAPTFVRSPCVAEIRLVDGLATIYRGHTLVCQAHITGMSPLEKLIPLTSIAGATAKPLYREDLLFHGPSWQMLVTADVDGASARAEVQLNGTDALATTIDGAHQLLATWSGRTTGFLGLPTGAKAWTLSPSHFEGPVRLELTAVVEDDGVVGEVRAIDALGKVVAHGHGIRLQNAGRWTDA